MEPLTILTCKRHDLNQLLHQQHIIMMFCLPAKTH